MRYFSGLPVKLYFFSTFGLVITLLAFLRSFETSYSCFCIRSVQFLCNDSVCAKIILVHCILSFLLPSRFLGKI